MESLFVKDTLCVHCVDSVYKHKNFCIKANTAAITPTYFRITTFTQIVYMQLSVLNILANDTIF